MKHLILVLITLFGITFLLITLSSATEFKNAAIEPANENNKKGIFPATKMEQYSLDVNYLNFKSYTMNQIEKNNQDIIKITDEIDQIERALEEERLRRITNLKKQNTQLNAGLNTYQIKNNGWQNFKSNFTTNFKRMGLPFSELF